MKMYKWFVWSRILKRYVALPHTFSDNRGDMPAKMLAPNFGELPPMFSIPMFGKHNACVE